MEPVDVERVAEPDLADPVLVEGLPGVGHVGKLAAEHLIEELENELVCRIYAEFLPPQVDVDDEGLAELTHLAIHAIETDGEDLLVLTGDHQAQSNEGHYRLADAILELAEGYGVGRLFALGGVPTGELIEEYAVLGAASEAALIDDLEAVGVEFREDEPAGGIVGISGLLLGMGARRGFEASCLMGETSGYLVDPKSARAVLDVLEEMLGFEVGYGSLEERADEMEEVLGTLQEMEAQQQMDIPTDEDLRYIG